MTMFRVLFVCTGNICRSPTAEGVFRSQAAAAGLSARIITDSAGTHSYHIGEQPDPRSQSAALARGIDLSDLRARKVKASDFHNFDLILAMDSGHLDSLQRMVPAGSTARVALFLDYADGHAGKDVPDPYYGGPQGFDEVLDLCEQGGAGILAILQN